MMHFWLILTILCVIFEAVTVGLMSIWFAGGALVACFLAMAEIHIYIQVAAFILVSFILIIVTRPLATKVINKNHTRTNYEGIIGKAVRITERVDNINETGTALVNGQEWTARTKRDNIVLEQGEVARVVNITGVKLIVEKYKD